MRLREKLKGKYYRLAVHVNEIPDCNNYKYTTKEIKQLFTSEAGKTKYTYNHGGEELSEITTVANYISEVDTVFNEDKPYKQIIPAGSHIKIIHSNNCKLNEDIHNNIINAVSSDQEPIFEKTCTANIQKMVNGFVYNGKTSPHDIEDMECMKYNTLAFVKQGCNGTFIEEIDYNFYIENEDLNYNENKTNKEDKKMVFSKMNKEDFEAVLEVMKVMNINQDTVQTNPTEEIQKIVKAEFEKIDFNEIIEGSDISIKNEKIDEIIEKFDKPKEWLESTIDSAFLDKLNAEYDKEKAEEQKKVAQDTLKIVNEKKQEELIKKLKENGYKVELPNTEIEEAKSTLEELGYNITIENSTDSEEEEEEGKEEINLQLENPKDLTITNTVRGVMKRPGTFGDFE